MPQVSFYYNKSFGGYLQKYFQNYLDQIYDQILARAERRTDEITNWLQQNAPWQDITGRARASLQAEITEVQEKYIELLLTYDDPDVYYAEYLETMQAGRFAILGPALDHWGPIIQNDIKEILS